MIPKRIFISHTNQGKIDHDLTVAIAVELRRVGIDVWLDWENPPPFATDEQKIAGPTPKNPLFQHIITALCGCDAVIYVVSQKSFSREFVRLEFDPRVMYEEFRKTHQNISPENIPFYLVLAEPIPNPDGMWSIMISTSFAGRCLNMIDNGLTPLLIPTVLMSMLKDVAPDYLLPLDPKIEDTARFKLEYDATVAPGCPQGVSPKTWRTLEGLFSLGPLFPGKLSSLSEDELWYGGIRTWQSIKLLQNFMIPTFSEPHKVRLRQYWANIMLRSRTHRGFDGKDLAVEAALPEVLRAAMEKADPVSIMAVKLQYGYALLTSSLRPNLQLAASLLVQCRSTYSDIGASPLYALSDLLFSRVMRITPAVDTKNLIEDLGFNCQDSDLHHLYHGVLDACFPGPRLEATPAYRTFVRSFLSTFYNASSAKVGYGKVGDGEPPSEYFEKVPR